MLARTQRMEKATLIALSMVILVGFSGFSVEVNVLSTPKDGSPGSFITHVFSLTNDSPDPVTYSLAFEVSTGWGILGAPTSIALQPNEEGTIFVTVTIPASATAGEYILGLTATSQSDALDQASATGIVIVAPMTEIELLTPTGASIAPGGSITYEFVLANKGNVQDSYTISAASSGGLSISLSHSAIDLVPQERLTFTVQIDVPLETDPGRGTLKVQVQSVLYDGVGANAVVSTSVLPPAPEAVAGTVMEELPARIRVSIDKNVMTNVFDSQFAFSTSGQILGGYFSSFFSLLDPFGPSAAEISSFSILYRRNPTTFSIGNVSQSLTDLVRLSCTGGSLKIDAEYYDLSIIGGGSNDETRFAGHVSLGPEVANIGIGYLSIRDPISVSESIWTATAHAEPLDDWTMSLEGSLGLDGPLTSRALFFNTSIDSSGYFFSGSAFSVGTFFPGQRADSAGIEVSQRLRLTAISLSTSLSHEWNNVIQDPLQETRIQDDLGLNLTATPLEDGPTLTSTINFSWDRYADTSLKSDLSTLLSVGLTETSGVFPYSLTGKVLEQQDLVLGSHVRTTTYSQGVGLDIDSFYLFFQLTQKQSLDVIADSQLSSSSDFSIRFRPESALHDASITFRNSQDDFDLSSSFTIHFTDALDIVFDGSIAWDRNDADAISFGWGIACNADVTLPLPFLVTKGRIEGRAFIDIDGDGLYGLNDEPAGGIVIGVGQSEVSTNADGYFRFTPFYPGNYTIAPDQLPINAAAPGPVSATVIAGETLWIDLPLLPVVVVSGDVFEDVNRNGTRDADEGGLAQIRVILESSADSSFADAFTDLAGQFDIADILPGGYVVSVDESSLPERFEFTTPEQTEIVITSQAPTPLSFGGYIREREVVITFQPPTADFVYDPQDVKTGTRVVFDGTDSFDFDGSIIAYAWDFNEDGIVDAVDPIVEYAFLAPGTFNVSLTVIDDTGNEDTIIAEVLVSAGAAIDPDSLLQPPVADFLARPAQPQIGESVTFDATASANLDGSILTYAWDFNADGVTDSAESIASTVFSAEGTYSVSLTVTDSGGNSSTVVYAVTVVSPSQDPADIIDLVIEPPTDTTTAMQPPIANYQVTPDTPESGETVVFNGTSSLDLDGLIASFAWDFDEDGNIDSTSPIAEYTFAADGSYSVALTVTDDDGNSDTIAMPIDIRSPSSEPAGGIPPVANFAYLPDQPDAGAVILFNATLSTDLDGQIVSFEWDFDGDGETDSSAAIVDYSYAEDGVYDVSLTVTDDAGATDVLTQQVTVGFGSQPPDVTLTLIPPVANFNYSPTDPQSGSLVVFNATLSADSDGQIASVAWDFNEDGLVDSTAAITEYTFHLAGTVAVSLTVTDDSGSTDTLTQQIMVTAPSLPEQPTTSLPPLSDFEYSPSYPRAGEQILFNGLISSDIDGEIIAYAWDFDDDGIIDAIDGFTSMTFQSPGTFNVSLTVTDNSGNSDRYTQAIFVDIAAESSSSPQPPSSSFQPPVADFSYMPTAVTAGELVLFNGSLSWDFDGEIVAYVWDFNGDGSPDSITPLAEHIFPSPGTVSVSLTVTDDSGSSDTLSLPIDVK